MSLQEAPASTENELFHAEVGNISRHSGVFFAGTLFTAAFGYFFKVYLARVLGAEALGIYALGMTVVGLLGIFGGLGLTWAASRFPSAYCSTGRTEELRSFLAWSVLSLIAVNGFFAVCIVLARRWISTSLYHTPPLAGYLYLFALIMFLGALTTFFGQLLTGYKEVAKRTVIANVGSVVFTAIFTVVLLKAGTGLRGYILAQVASALLILILLVRVAVRFTPVAARNVFRRLQFPPRDMFSFATAAFAMDVVGFLYSQTDKVILGFYLNARSVGIYAVAGAVVAFLPIALQSVNQIFSPTIADLHARGEFSALNRLFQTLTKWILGLTLPIAMVVMIFSHQFMRAFGRDFESGWPILVIGAVGQLVNCAVGSVGYLLLMSGNERRLLRIQVAMAVATVSLCVLLVPKWGVLGAAAAAALGNAGTNAWCLWEVKKVLGLFPYNRSYSKLVLPTATSLAVAVGLWTLMRPIPQSIVVVVITTLAVFAAFVGTVLLFGLDNEDRLIARAAWTRVRALLPVSQVGIV